MGRYLQAGDSALYLQIEGTEITAEEAEALDWNPKVFLVAQVVSYPHKPAIVCFHTRELEYIQRSIPTEEREVKYYLVLASKLEGNY